MVETKTYVLIVSVLMLLLTGTTYTAAVLQDPPQNNTDQTPTIIVSGDGSSGTGNVTNTQIVEIETKQIEQGEGIIDASEELTSNEYYQPNSKSPKPSS